MLKHKTFSFLLLFLSTCYDTFIFYVILCSLSMGIVVERVKTIMGVLGLHPETRHVSTHGLLAVGSAHSPPHFPAQLPAGGKERETDIPVPMSWLPQSTADGNPQGYCNSHTGIG